MSGQDCLHLGPSQFVIDSHLVVRSYINFFRTASLNKLRMQTHAHAHVYTLTCPSLLVSTWKTNSLFKKTFFINLSSCSFWYYYHFLSSNFVFLILRYLFRLICSFFPLFTHCIFVTSFLIAYSHNIYTFTSNFQFICVLHPKYPSCRHFVHWDEKMTANWRCRSTGMWRHVGGWVVPDVSMDHITFMLLDLEDMAVSSFETFGTIRPKTHCQIAEE